MFRCFGKARCNSSLSSLSMKLGILMSAILINVTATAQSLQTDSTKNKKTANKKQLSLEIYGFILADVIYDFKQMDPKWFDVPRPTKLPAYKDQFAPDGQIYFSVRQTRFGVKSSLRTPFGPMTTLFEFDMLGAGADAGQTTIHLRHAYGELGKFGAGQTWSPFVDIDVFPNDLEYWGPNGMANIRNVQFRYMPIKGDTKLTIALEKPSATSDDGLYSDVIELNNIKPRFAVPDLTAEYRRATPWGYVELAGILRELNGRTSIRLERTIVVMQLDGDLI